MSSTPETDRPALGEAQKTAPDNGPSRHIDNGRVRPEDEEPKRAKKKKRSKGGAAKRRVTGFEEYYCDPPMTPAEHNEEKNVIYPPHRPFVDRIEECIQRFRTRRRMDNQRDHLFSMYLTLGGIDATVRQFQSTRDLGNDILEDATKASIREMTADDVIQRGGDGNRDPRFYNPNYPEHWDVDFTGVVSGFLSEHLPRVTGINTHEFFMGAEVVSNFLKYVDHHDVCPEYAEDLKNAQAVCLQALEEMPAIAELLMLVPGDFNTAMRALHCKDEAEDLSGFANRNEPAAFDTKQARIISAASLSILLGPDRFQADTDYAVTGVDEQTFEIREITLPDATARAKYKAVNQHLGDYLDVKPCGTITVFPVAIQDGWDNTMNATIPPEAAVESQFILEEDILQLLEVGMKLAVGVCTMKVGFKFIKYVKSIMPTFYVFLPQELMLNYKEPVPTDRPAPSIHDKDADGDVLAGIPFGDRDD